MPSTRKPLAQRGASRSPAPRRRSRTPAAASRSRTPARKKKLQVSADVATAPCEQWTTLKAIHEAPEWMRHNPFILHGYRVNYSVQQCLRSLWFLHNEFGNVWTHILGFGAFIALGIYVFFFLLQPVLAHHLIFAFFTFGCLCCMLLSTCFHLFSAHHDKAVYDRMLTLDYLGITLLTIFSFYPPCFLLFVCQPTLRYVYLISISLLGSIGIFGPLCEWFHDESYTWLRLTVFVTMAGSGAVPIGHSIWAVPFNSTTRPVVAGIALMLLLYAVGLIFYVFKVPERWFPGRFDIWLHSHQLWHLFVLAASLVHYFTCMAMYLRWNSLDIGHC